MAKKASKIKSEPLKLFYIFYNQERWDNWLKTLSEVSFEAEPDSDEMPEGLRILDSFSEDITVSVLKVIKLYQNKRFTKEETFEKLGQIEMIVMSAAPEGDLEEVIEILQLPKLALFRSCQKYLDGGFDKEIKSLVKKGKTLIESDMEAALDVAANIGASVIDGASCCSKYVKDDIESPTLFDEWLIECERMNDAITTLKNFDETTGDED
jgi:hypothetical protein